MSRRKLGAELRRLRVACDLTIEAVADTLECAPSKISRIETGVNGVTPRDVRDLLTIYGVTGPSRDELVRVARSAREKGWWHLFPTVVDGGYVGMEAVASSIRQFDAQTVPSLLRTPDYHRAICRAIRPSIPEAGVEQRVRALTIRQDLLTADDPIEAWMVIDEAALRRPIGCESTMRGQLEHLVEVCDLPNVTVQVLPFEAGAHAGMSGPITILGFPEVGDPDMVYVETLVGGSFLERLEDRRRYLTAFDHVRTAAARPEDSVALLAKLAKE